jgi:hypothetical protein
MIENRSRRAAAAPGGERGGLMVTNEQLYLLIGIPMLSNAVVTGLGIAFLKTRFDASDRRFDDIGGARSFDERKK